MVKIKISLPMDVDFSASQNLIDYYFLLYQKAAHRSSQLIQIQVQI